MEKKNIQKVFIYIERNEKYTMASEKSHEELFSLGSFFRDNNLYGRLKWLDDSWK